MRIQSWQVRLIPLFYRAGIIKGLSNNNYASKVGTLLSCSHCEWRRGVCVRGTTRKWEEVRAWVRLCLWRGIKARSEHNNKSQNITQPKSHWSVRNTCQYIQEEEKSDISFARGNTNPWESLHTEYLEIQDEREWQAGDSAWWRLWGAGVNWVTAPLWKADGRWSNAWWHRSFATYLLFIDWPHTGYYGYGSLTTAFHHYCRTSREWKPTVDCTCYCMLLSSLLWHVRLFQASFLFTKSLQSVRRLIGGKDLKQYARKMHVRQQILSPEYWALTYYPSTYTICCLPLKWLKNNTADCLKTQWMAASTLFLWDYSTCHDWNYFDAAQ